MEKLMRLPPGFRFHPTDEELVVQYLKRKAFACPLPASIIPEIDLNNYNPWDLPGCIEGERYFFTLREAKYRKGSRAKRATRSGYWKATGSDRPITGSGSKRNEIVGMKRILVFHRGKPSRGVRTDWIMHEYRLVAPQTKPYSPQGEEWVVCRVFRKKRAMQRDEEASIQDSHEFGSPSSCSSSCVTDISGEECTSVGEEASSKLIAPSP